MRPSGGVQVTVAIPTWNRCQRLDRALALLGRVERPASLRWEVLVVDNGSTDATQAVIRRHAGALPIRSVIEPEPGVSNARNCAVRHARGEWMLGTDDDVLVEPGWLAAYLAAIAAHPEASFFGGPLLPHFEAPPPRWVVEGMPRLRGVYSLRVLGDEPFEFDARELPYGGNFAARTEVLRRYPYDSRLGRIGRALIAGEETAVLEAMLADGHRGWWIPEARVYHALPPERLTLRYLRAVAYGLGQTDEIRGVEPEASRRRMRLEALGLEARWRVLGWVRPPDRWIKHLLRSSYLWGRLAGSRRPAAVP